jgi:ethanolamine utilization protein EutA
VFSRIVMERQGARLSSAYVVVDREVLGRSPILLTPYQAGTRIDTAALGAFFGESYRAAGVRREDIDTGALIVTGDAANKENAPAIAELFARESGRFVCATAGPHLEAVLAAHGSGAVARSRGRTVLELDVGGGTTKVSVVRDGAILDTAAFAAGARVVTFAADGTVARIEEGARFAAETAGIPLALGRAADRGALANVLADAIASVVRRRRFDGLARDLLVTEPIELPERIDLLIVSGGVSEYVYGREAREFGDLGPLLGAALATRLGEPGMPKLDPPDEGIRATVIGAGQYTVQLSGSTVLVSRPDLLPQRDLVVVRPQLAAADGAGVQRAISRSLERARREDQGGAVAIALSMSGEPSHARLFELASGIAGAAALLAPDRPLVLVFDTDLGRSVGRILQEEVLSGRDIIAIDEVRLADFDRIDIGSEVEAGGAVPVVVKTLVFRTAPREMDG